MSSESERSICGEACMARKKMLVDKGLLLVLTGNGKGKSSSAFGMIARALGHGMKVGVVQFIKSRTDTGEVIFFSSLPNVEWHVMGEGFTWETQNRDQDTKTAQSAWKVAKNMLQDPSFDLVVLDELINAIQYGYLDVDLVLRDLQFRPKMQHVVITGRGAPPALIEIADTVTEMRQIKHAYETGIRAQRGIEW